QGPGRAPALDAAHGGGARAAAFPGALPRRARSARPRPAAPLRRARAGQAAPSGRARAARGRRPALAGSLMARGRLAIRAPNWVGDLVMATPVLEAACASPLWRDVH